MKPSTLPWKVTRHPAGEMEGSITDAKGNVVCLMHKPGKREWKPLQGEKQCEANAEGIVAAVNNYAETKEQLEKLADYITANLGKTIAHVMSCTADKPCIYCETTLFVQKLKKTAEMVHIGGGLQVPADATCDGCGAGVANLKFYEGLLGFEAIECKTCGHQEDLNREANHG